MKYQVTVKTNKSNNLFDTTVEADRIGQATTGAMIEFLKTTKIHGDLVLYKVIDENGNTVLDQFN